MDTPTVSLKFRVRYAETDQMGVVYYANYLIWFEMGRAEYCRRMGFSYASLEGNGFRLMVADAHCRYKAPARYDEIIRIETTIQELKKKTLIFGYRIYNEKTDQLLAQGYTKHACIDQTGRLIRLPDTFVQCLLPPTQANSKT
jgi:acyl-CoA thioester hydrolase